MSITDLDRKAIDESAENLFWVENGKDSLKHIEIYADYRDTNEFLLQNAYDKRKVGFESKEHAEHAFLDSIREQIYECYFDTIFEYQDRIIKGAGFDFSAAEYLEYLRENYCIEPNFDHFLEQNMLVNVMIGLPAERDSDFGSIRSQYEAISDDEISPAELKAVLDEENGLSWLVKQQGHTMEELKKVLDEYQELFYGERNTAKIYAAHDNYTKNFKDFSSEHGKFLSSVCQELDNMPNYMNTLTILAQVNMYQFAEMMRNGKEITFPKGTMLGLFNPWVGGGSVLEIELENELVLSSEIVFDIQIEGAKPDYQYSVDDIYGLSKSCWKEPLSICDSVSSEKPNLDNIVASAAARAGAQTLINFEKSQDHEH